MLSQMDPALVAYCDKIVTQGGPMHMPEELGGSTFPLTPVMQLGTVTRVSARLRNVQPEVNPDQSYGALKRPKKNVDAAHAGIYVLVYFFVVPHFRSYHACFTAAAVCLVYYSLT